MPTRANTNYFRLKDDNEFEELLCDLCSLEWHDPNAQLYGRRGQEQHGIDIYGRPAWLDGDIWGVQCKLRPSQKQISIKEIKDEIVKARTCPLTLSKFILATDTARDKNLQNDIARLSQEEQSLGSFAIEIWFWDDIVRKIATFPSIIVKYYRDHLSAITNLSEIDRLIDTALQIGIFTSGDFSQLEPLSEAIRFRGINTVFASLESSELFAIGRQLPDGIVVDLASLDNKDIHVFVQLTAILRQQVEDTCPFFVVLSNQFIRSAETILHDKLGKSHGINILNANESPHASANLIFERVFDYGYERRASLPSIPMCIRSTKKKSSGNLLDINWSSQLAAGSFPSKREWVDSFEPSLVTVASKLTSLRDSTRILIDSELFVPASVAIGFFLNLRVAIVGVWGRRMGQRNVKQIWWSDGLSSPIDVETSVYETDSQDSKAAAIELTTGASIHTTVREFAATNELELQSWLEIKLSSPVGIDESQAVTYVNQVAAMLRELNAKGITDFHLFLRIPSALGVLLGQRLHACGRLHLYWFDNQRSTYQYAFHLA